MEKAQNTQYQIVLVNKAVLVQSWLDLRTSFDQVI